MPSPYKPKPPPAPPADRDAGPALRKKSKRRGKMATAHMATTTLRVGGMTCGACTSAVESGFEGVSGAGSVSVSLIMERAVVQHDPNVLSPQQITEIIEDRGFEAAVLSTDTAYSNDHDVTTLYDSGEDGEDAGTRLSQTTVHVGGMTCGACTSSVEGAFNGVAGVKSFSISLLSERAVIEHDSKLLPAEKIAEAIEDAGFEAKVLETKTARSRSKRRRGSRATEQKILTTTVSIEGMTCGACTSAVEAGFKDLDGLVQFNISLLAERAVITHDPTKLSAQSIVQIIDDRGFDAKLVSSVDGSVLLSSSSQTIRINLFGLKDMSDASTLESTLRSLPGVATATVDFKSSRASITHTPSKIGLRAIVGAIEGAGFNGLLADSDDKDAQLESLAKTKEIVEWRRAFWRSLTFTIPVFLTAMIIPAFIPFLDYGSIRIIPGLYFSDVVCLLLTIPVQFGIGWRFYISAFKSVKHGSPTMDVLVVLGTSAAFFFSCAAMAVSIIFSPHTRPGTVFETSSILITFVTLGRYMENSAKGQTSKALSRLMNLAPSMATIYADPIAAAKAVEKWEANDEKQEKPSRNSISLSTEEKAVATELIEVGDIVILKPGDKVPADGTVLRGESYVDESMVTGEPVPILKNVGAPLMAGTVNGAGRVDFIVTRAGRDTQLSQIVRLVQEAQTSRAPIQRMADVVAGYFVQVIITLGLATFVAWMILSHVLPNPPPIFLEVTSGGKTMVCVKLCIAVIVFACPCALGLSTPTAVMVGTGVGAEHGILIKGGAALEIATKVTHVVLDKTGTLTIGKMSVSKTDIHGEYASSDAQKRLWWTIIGLAEMSSEHPIAKAVVLSAKDNLGLGPEGVLDGSVGDFEAVVGAGITASVQAAATAGVRHQVLIGNAKFLRSRGIDVPASAEPSAFDMSNPNTPMTPSFTKTANGKISANAGTTIIHTAIHPHYTGTLHLSDTLKPAAPATVAALHRMGISCSIVTGDSLAPALVVANLVGIAPEHVHAGATPSDKKEFVEALQRPVADGGTGHTVAMVGDGINDSPALATAAVGIALASGTDVAMEAAGIVLMNAADLLSVPASLHLSRAIFRRIKMNLVWACGYNVVGLPFAMGFFLPWGYSLHPMAAGAAMACSSVSVVASSLALKWWARPKWMREDRLHLGEGARMAKAHADGRIVGRGLLTRGLEVLREMVGGKKRWSAEVQRGAYVPLRDIGDV